jgi:hypothetical protein
MSSPSGIALIILLDVNVLPDAPVTTSIAFDIEFDIVFPKIFLLEEPEFTLIPVLLLDIVLLYIWLLCDCETKTPDGSFLCCKLPAIFLTEHFHNGIFIY